MTPPNRSRSPTLTTRMIASGTRKKTSSQPSPGSRRTASLPRSCFTREAARCLSGARSERRPPVVVLLLVVAEVEDLLELGDGRRGRVHGRIREDRGVDELLRGLVRPHVPDEVRVCRS